MTRALRVLHLEDNPRDADLVRDRLEVDGVDCDIQRANGKASFESALVRETFDIIISDFNLPGYDGIAALKQAQETQPDVPVILVSGTVSEEQAVQCLQVGATDYLLKGRLDRLGPAVLRAIQEADTQRVRKRAEEALAQSERRKTAILDSVLDCIVTMDAAGSVIEFNASAERTFGYTKAEAFGRSVVDLIVPPARRDAYTAALTRYLATYDGPMLGQVVESTAVRSDGTELPVELSITTIHSDKGPIFTGVLRDITSRQQAAAELKRLNDEILQGQKMEAIGRLAGGVAHDFNNLLTVILGNCELMLDDLDPDDQRQADLAQIQKAGLSAAGLTRQLLAFSRKEIIEPRLIDLNAVLESMRPMLRRLIREDVEIVLALCRDPSPIKADRGQVEQLVLNLAVNARDAMPSGGLLTMEIANVELGDDYVRTRLTATAGSYASLTVTDTGAGMTPDVQARLFEPFFTTKEVGKGTGLGLAMVHGIVTQNGGRIDVSSQLGKGTSFKLYFPRADAAGLVADAPPAAPVSRAEAATVLLVEDEEGLRLLVTKLLQRHGYTVLVAADADHAVQLSLESKTIDLLLTDVVMPGCSGPELTKRLVERRPGLKVIYMSGYTDEAIVHHGVLDPGIAFLHKPFTSEALGRKLQEVLDR